MLALDKRKTARINKQTNFSMQRVPSPTLNLRFVEIKEPSAQNPYWKPLEKIKLQLSAPRRKQIKLAQTFYLESKRVKMRFSRVLVKKNQQSRDFKHKNSVAERYVKV